jgi:glycosyltransferase involved in cell wall biosynthesis
MVRQTMTRLLPDANEDADDGSVGLDLLVLIPALNEIATIADVVSRVPSDIAGIRSVRILVVDDGSDDGTADAARSAGADVVSHRHNRGVGKALQTGLAEAVRRSATIVINIDGDGQFAPEDIPKVLAPVIAGDADVATASRFMDPALTPRMPFVKRLGNRGMSWIISKLTGHRFHDVSCGFRAYSKEAIHRLVLVSDYTYTQEMFLALSYRGFRIQEIPLEVRGEREHGKSRVASNLFRYGYHALGIILGSVRDYRPSLFFNTISLGALFIIHRIVAGSFTPQIWSGFVSAYLIGLAIVLFVSGQVAAMSGRNKALLEEQLYLLKQVIAERNDREEAVTPDPTLADRDESDHGAGER